MLVHLKQEPSTSASLRHELIHPPAGACSCSNLSCSVSISRRSPPPSCCNLSPLSLALYHAGSGLMLFLSWSSHLYSGRFVSVGRVRPSDPHTHTDVGMTLRSFYLVSWTWKAQWRMSFSPSRSARRARASLLLSGVLICVIIAAVGATVPGKGLSVWHMVVAQQLKWALVYYTAFVLKYWLCIS